MELMKAISDAAVDGLILAGFSKVEAVRAIGRRIEAFQDSKSSEVKQAAKNRKLGRPPQGFFTLERRTLSQPN
ncbi:hypothetical protein [Aureimonas mangrovi]|uniref:hypothetical protein n=1 Tax=Aureimonas mangrovi TaxID=2758041 RepID=UPI00163D82CE|nr:hypothetical protein [Aureimonas mangrovi]